MNGRKLISLGTTGACALVAFAGVSTAQADGKTTIDKGGAFCFQFGSTAPGATRTVLSLDIDPADHPTKQRLWWASGVEKATNADVSSENYVNTLAGSATLARPNNGVSGSKRLHMALTGTSYGSETATNSMGLWQLNYNLQLNPKTLKGKIIGLSVFTPLSGTTSGTASMDVTNTKIKPLNCKRI